MRPPDHLRPAATALLVLLASLLGALAPASACRRVDTAGRAAASPAAPTAENNPPPAPLIPDAGPAAPPVVIAAAGDIAGRVNRHRSTATLLATLARREPLAALLALGDLQYPTGAYQDFLTYYDPTWGQPLLRAITRPVPGNHEYDQGRSDASGYFDYFDGPGESTGMAGDRGKGYYSFDLGDWHLVALNSSDGCRRVSCAVGSAMHTWLVHDLQNTKKKCVLAYWHHPRFQIGYHPDSSMVAPLWNALYDARADVVLNGHDHNFQALGRLDKKGHLDPQGIRSFVVGTGGAPAYVRFNQSLHPGAGETILANRAGVLLMTLEPGAYHWRFVAAETPDGRVLAQGHDVCR